MAQDVDVEMFSKLLDAAQEQLDDVGKEMRRMLDDVEKKILPQEEALQTLQSHLGEISAMRADLAAQGAAFVDELPASGALDEWHHALTAYEEKCTHAAERKALLLLQRLYAEDEACQAAIETLRTNCCSWDADVLGKKKPALLASIKLLMEAFQEKKPMMPLRKIAHYMLKLKDFPEILISAVTLNDPPLFVQEPRDEVASEEAVSGKAAEEQESENSSIQETEDNEDNKEEKDPLISTDCFNRVQGEYVKKYETLEVEDLSFEKMPTAKNIKNYLKQCTDSIRSLRCVALREGISRMFTARWIESRTKSERHVVEQVLKDMVQRGLLRTLHFHDLPLLYDVPTPLYRELNVKEILRFLQLNHKLPQLKENKDMVPLDALQAILYEKAHCHADKGNGVLQSQEHAFHCGSGYFLLTARTARREAHYVFLEKSPTVRWLKYARAALKKENAALYLLAFDDRHIEESRSFLAEHIDEAIAFTGTYTWSDDAWKERTREAIPTESEDAQVSVPATAPDEAAPAAEESVGTAPMPAQEAVAEAVAEEPPPAVAAPSPADDERVVAEEAATVTENLPPQKSAEVQAAVPAASSAASTMPGKLYGAFMEDAVIEKTFHAMLEAEDFASTSAYLHAAAYFSPASWKQLNQEFAYALAAPLQKCRYSSDVLMDVYFTQSTAEPHEGLAVAAMLWNFYLDHTSYDYGMQGLLDMAKSFDLLKDAPGLSDVLYTLMKFKQEEKSGADKYADYRLKDKSRMEETLRGLQVKARENEAQYVYGPIKETGSNRRFIETQKLLFHENGELANALRLVAEGDREAYEIVREYAVKTFLDDAEGGAPNFEVQNIHADKIDRLIDDCWYEASKLVLIKKMTSKLIGAYRNSLQKRLEKIAAIMVQWVKCCEALSIDDKNSSLPAYRKMHGRLIEQLEKAQDSLEETALPAWERKVLSHTLAEIARRLRGDYDEKEQRYFYIDFLRTPYVLLDDSYLPRITQPVGDLASFFPLQRIERHFAAEKLSFTARLQEILNGTDDFGSARLILDYLEDTGEALPPEVRTMFARMDEASIVAHAERVKKDFIEGLELAQSYGQIESAAEDKKERILEMTETWFERCRANLDYGFFAAIIEAFKKKIEVEAERRGRSLANELDQLQAGLPTSPDEEDRERRKAKIARIRHMIDIKNYTVAEDMLHRFSDDADDSPLESLQSDELRDFLHFYDIIYNEVYRSDRTLSAMIHLRGRNKETRGGEALLEAWPKSGKGANQSTMMKQLLRGLGFSVAAMEAHPLIGKTENYDVRLAEAVGGRRNYAHPFAAFGSRATETPFRVICLYGKFDADALIDRFKEIGTSRHTLVFLDYALRKDQRNRLARKTKLEIPECAFAVVDRVVIGYLAEHYAETKINRMLLSITMPYTFYQPYIPNAANPMPPEMFIGRKEALDKIVNPLGENIVYGGRQLGKSALLRMAEYTINRTGDGSRALMVDIKSCGIEEAALRISRELADRGILAADFETQDWAVLARAIRRRLDEPKKRIPYLLLLIDEADAFIESSKAVNYRPFEELKNIQSIGQERFKFVIAGLRNVVRFDKEALSNNSVLAHLKSYTVRPFSVMEARELLEVPLACLGLRFSEEKQALVSTILATTNYFPGLIQLYCYKLLEAMKKDYAGYEEANTPPYEINEKHIKKVLAEADFTQDIYNKFDITLRVDEDCYYHILATLMADLYHEGEKPEGYQPEDILNHGRAYGIKKMEMLSLENVHALMEELRELNIFRLTVGGRYLFARYNFFQLMGSKEHLENELLAYMED